MKTGYARLVNTSIEVADTGSTEVEDWRHPEDERVKSK